MNQLTSRRFESGLTAIEMMITVFVAAIFVLAFYTLFISVNQSYALSRNRATASDIAYSNLRKYASAGSDPSWFVCDATAGASNTNDSVINANATGQVLESGTLTNASTKLPDPITYSIKALAIYGCNGTNTKKPLRVESQITYGPNAKVIKHTTMVGY